MATGGEDSADSKRNLVVDEAAFEEQFLRCHICREKFDQADKTPKSLPCNHTFCLPCLKQVFDHSQQNARRQAFAWADDSYEGVLKCPTCRVEIFLSRSEIGALPNDHRVIQMMDFLCQVVVKSQNVCSKHERQPLNFFCRTCLVPVCRDCTVLDHKEQSDHIIVDVTQALKDNSDEFNNVENRSKQLLQSMKARSDALANASKRLDLLERQLRSKIKDTFIEYRLLLERRQEAEISILHETIKQQKSLINARFVDVCTQGSQLQKLFDSFTKARPANDITQLFTVHKQMKDSEDDFSKAADSNDDELFVTCQFEVTNEPLFLSELSCLGDVTQEPDLELKKPVPAHQLVVMDMEDRRIRESAQEPDPIDCDDLMVTHVEPSTRPADSSSSRSRERDRIAERMAARAQRLREAEEAEDMDQEQEDVVTSSYLLRIASRLNESSANLSEAILDLSSTPTPDSGNPTPSPPSNRRAASASALRRTQNQNVRVVRHDQRQEPAPPAPSRSSHGGRHGYLSSRYGSGDQR